MLKAESFYQNLPERVSYYIFLPKHIGTIIQTSINCEYSQPRYKKYRLPLITDNRLKNKDKWLYELYNLMNFMNSIALGAEYFGIFNIVWGGAIAMLG